ncbi:MAG: hypothetical protein LBQ95_04220 [Lachnospiraceae bacterium]|jgi:capsular polysaccharide biosynthesis protein|nr:hypothetical protein [Lachnospiraceae bacterium]
MSEETREVEINFRDVLYVLKKRFIWIVLIGAFVAAIAGVITVFMITPMYTASATMYVYADSNRNDSLSSAITSTELSASKSLVDTYIVILKSNTVLKQAIEQLDLKMDTEELKDLISASSVNGTEVFSISVKHSDPFMAAQIANTLTDIVPSEIIRVVKAGGVEVVDVAETPKQPSSPNMKLNLAVAFLLGALLAYGIFLLASKFDTKVQSASSLDTEFGIPVLGEVPRIMIDGSSSSKY